MLSLFFCSFFHIRTPQMISTTSAFVKLLIERYTRSLMSWERRAHQYCQLIFRMFTLTNMHSFEALVGATVVSYMHALEFAGLDSTTWDTALKWATSYDTVTLRFTANSHCRFDRSVVREVDGGVAVRQETALGGLFGETTKTVTTKLVSNVTSYHWNFSSNWALELVRGAGRVSGDVLPLAGRQAAFPLVLEGYDRNPHPETYALEPQSLRLTWLLRHLAADGSAASFSINRSAAGCHTPRRNGDVEAALAFGREYAGWASLVDGFFRNELFPADPHLDAHLLGAVHARGLFLPSALFEGAPASPVVGDADTGTIGSVPPHLAPGSGGTASPLLLSLSSMNRLLDEARAGLIARVAECSAVLPPANDTGPLTGTEAGLLVGLEYGVAAAKLAEDGVAYIEALLRSQASVGWDCLELNS
jgi:hypothetical protein